MATTLQDVIDRFKDIEKKQPHLMLEEPLIVVAAVLRDGTVHVTYGYNFDHQTEIK